MSFIVAALLGGFGILVATIAGLLVQRRALRESVEQFRLRTDQAPVLIWTVRSDTSLDYLNGFCEPEAPPRRVEGEGTAADAATIRTPGSCS